MGFCCLPKNRGQGSIEHLVLTGFQQINIDKLEFINSEYNRTYNYIDRSQSEEVVRRINCFAVGFSSFTTYRTQEGSDNQLASIGFSPMLYYNQDIRRI